MGDPKWIMVAISGIGEVCVWAEEEDLLAAFQGGSSCGVHNLTQIVMSPKGLGLRKMAKDAVLYGHQVAAIWEPDVDTIKAISAFWDGQSPNGIALPTDQDRRRLRLMP